MSERKEAYNWVVSDCCNAAVQEYHPEDTHARCKSCGEMAEVVDIDSFLPDDWWAREHDDPPYDAEVNGDE